MLLCILYVTSMVTFVLNINRNTNSVVCVVFDRHYVVNFRLMTLTKTQGHSANRYILSVHMFQGCVLVSFANVRESSGISHSIDYARCIFTISLYSTRSRHLPVGSRDFQLILFLSYSLLQCDKNQIISLVHVSMVRFSAYCSVRWNQSNARYMTGSKRYNCILGCRSTRVN